MGNPRSTPLAPSRRKDGLDGFGAIVDPAAYVPRPATVRALSALRAAVVEGAHPAVLRGPGGMGKTLLLRLLALRVLPMLRPVYVPIPTLSQSELCNLVLGLLDQPASAHPESELLDFCMTERDHGRALLLLIDDADSLCPDVARGLAGLAACSHRSLRIALAMTDDERSERILVALGADAVVVPLDEPMSLAETERYLRMRLSRTHAGDVVDHEICARVHQECGGIPGELHVAVSRGRASWP